MLKICCILFTFSIATTLSSYDHFVPSGENCNPKVLSQWKKIQSDSKNSTTLSFFVSLGTFRSHLLPFAEAKLWINLTDHSSFQIFKGPDCTTIRQEYYSDNYAGIREKNYNRSIKELPVFSRTVIGIATRESFQISLQFTALSFRKLYVFIASIMLFVLSREISEILSGSRSECAWFIQIVAFSNIYQSSQVRSN
ncbi:hypothetical protein PRIPAC_89731, partial [Pristionchus pacificus]